MGCRSQLCSGESQSRKRPSLDRHDIITTDQAKSGIHGIAEEGLDLGSGDGKPGINGIQ
jgi:hypothetical protein